MNRPAPAPVLTWMCSQLRCALLLLCLGSSSSGVAQPPAPVAEQQTPRVVRLVARFDAAVQAGRVQRARAALARLFAAAPVIALERSETLLKHPDATEHDAARFLVMAESAPRTVQVWRTVGRAHWMLGDAETALSTLARQARLLSQDEESAALLVLIAAKEIEDDELTRAAACLELARRLRPQSRAIVVDLAGLWVAQGEGRRAVRLLQWRLQQHPAEEDTQRQLARTLLGLGDYAEAVSLWRGLAASNGSSADWASAAHASLAGGDATRAFALAERALEGADIEERTEEAAQLAKGLAAVILGRPEDARQALSRVLILSPGHLAAQNAMGVLPPRSD